jgi:predicted dehydrogenase
MAKIPHLSRRAFLGQTARTLGAGAALGLGAARVTADPPATDRRIRIGVVGGGFGGSFQWHLHPNCVVHAVSDLRADRREHLMKTYGCPRSYESLETLVLDKELDAVAVFTGAPDHVRHGVLAMEAGKHVICAVPAAMSLEECEKLREVKEKTHRRYMMAETSYYRHDTIAARDLFAAGRFGELFYSEVEYYHPLNQKERDYYWIRDGKRTWRYGYAPMLYPTHSTGFLVGVTRERLTHVSCLGWGAADDEPLKDNAYNNPFTAAMGLFKTDRGHMCRCGVFFSGTAHGERAQWFGTKLTFYMAGSGGQPFAITGEGAPDWKQPPDFHERLPEALRVASGHGGSHTFLTHEFVSALIEDREPAIDVYESLAMTAPGIVAHQSALKGGEQLKVPDFDRKA